MDVRIGLRVVRGPNWKWGDQDGGEGHLGTVVQMQKANRPDTEPGKWTACVVTVQWDCGNRCRYRCGIGDKYDLKVFDSAPAGVIHSNVVCDNCGSEAITGTRWRCVKCYDFDLCTDCYMAGKHSLEHEFDRMDSSRIGVRVPVRGSCKKHEVRGIFRYAEVVPGHDWQEQDGVGESARIGEVLCIQGIDGDDSRSFAEVEWKDTQKTSLHRVGYQGKVDLKCTDPSSGGYYYPEHLPVLGAEPPPPNPLHISSGDMVRVELDPEVFKAMQEGHGGWNEPMLEIIGKTGTVTAIADSGDLQVKYPNYIKWTICPEAVVKVDIPRFRVGDMVRLDDDVTKVIDLQQGHGDWGETIMLLLGETGRVLQVLHNGDIMLAIKGRTWVFNALCLTPAEEKVTTMSPTSELYKKQSTVSVQMTILTLLESESPTVVVAATLASEISVLKTYLKKFPDMVDFMPEGRSALHCASLTGNLVAMKVLLEFGADLELADEYSGNKPLQLAATNGYKEAVQVLLDSGADVNSKNIEGYTALCLAALAGHTGAVKTLVNHPKIEINEPDGEGNTALHNALLVQKNGVISALLDAGADPTLLNLTLYTPIHDAARIGFLPAMEQFIARFPEHLNLKMEYNYTPLHTAALCNHCDIITLLAETRGCEIEAKNDWGQTPLHIALLKGHSKIVERLVGYGANVNTEDADGNMTLHMIISRQTMEAPSSDSPELNKIHTVLFGRVPANDSPIYACISTAVFLLKHGADIHHANKKGASPLSCFPYISTLMAVYVENAELLEKGPEDGDMEGGLFRTYYGGLPRLYHVSEGDADQSYSGGQRSSGRGSSHGSSGGSTRGYRNPQSSHSYSSYPSSYGYGGQQGSYGYGGQQSSYGYGGQQGSYGYGGQQGSYGYGGQQGSYGYGSQQSSYFPQSSAEPRSKQCRAPVTVPPCTQHTLSAYPQQDPDPQPSTSSTSQHSTDSTPQHSTATAPQHNTASIQQHSTMSFPQYNIGYTPQYNTAPILQRTTAASIPQHSAAPILQRGTAASVPQHSATGTSQRSTAASIPQHSAAPIPQREPLVTGGGSLCFLCDNPADVKFSPCGHSSMCSECAPRAKRCPTCKSPVESFCGAAAQCVMCGKESAIVRRQCGHEFCKACDGRHVLCIGCQQEDLD